jgi:hypothetical protein
VFTITGSGQAVAAVAHARGTGNSLR